MIARRGPRTCLLDAHSRAVLAGAARPLRHRQGSRDPDPASRGRRAAPHQPPTNLHLARPRRAQRTEQTAARPATPAAAGLASDAAALARPTRRPPLDLPAPTTRPTTHLGRDPGLGAANGSRKSPLGLPTHPERAGRPRPCRGRLDRLEDPQERRARSGAPTIRPNLATVPIRPGPRDPRDRLRPRRHHIPTPPLHPHRDRARPPPRAPRRNHRPPHRRLDYPTGPQPAYGPRRARRPVPVPDPRPRQQVHRRLRRRPRRRRHPDHPHPGTSTTGECNRGTVHRDNAPGMPRPPPDHRNPTPLRRPAGVLRALQRASSAPITASTPADGWYLATLRSGHQAAPTRPARRTPTRVRPGRMA
jgi:hypothetical protein